MLASLKMPMELLRTGRNTSTTRGRGKKALTETVESLSQQLLSSLLNLRGELDGRWLRNPVLWSRRGDKPARRRRSSRGPSSRLLPRIHLRIEHGCLSLASKRRDAKEETLQVVDYARRAESGTVILLLLMCIASMLPATRCDTNKGSCYRLLLVPCN